MAKKDNNKELLDSIGVITILLDRTTGHTVVSSSNLTNRECYNVCRALADDIVNKLASSEPETEPASNNSH